MNTFSYAVAFFGAILLATSTTHARLARPLARAAGRDTTCAVWVIFTDKDDSRTLPPRINPRARKRRHKAGYPAVSAQDIPVSKRYLTAIENHGGHLRHTFPWANAASFTIDARRLRGVDTLPFVKAVIPVATHEIIPPPARPGGLGKSADHPGGLYGQSRRELSMLDVPRVHAHIAKTLGKPPGDDVIIGMFDTGFWLDHPAFAHILAGDAVVGDSDFVDPTSDPYFTYADHGAETMSTIGGYDPGSFMGVAWGARFILARTENDWVEEHIEEDHWAAAMVWAEALGVDIVSSSLGYFGEFTDSIGDYTFEDMDGKTTIISKAAKEATERGVLVVNAMGNYSSVSELLINAPADVEDVISVGAVDSTEKIATFSCLGPTADGRLKPDLVAMGSQTSVISSGDGYSTNSGTSFSTPLVAGAVALIKQLYPDDSAEEIRRRLYASCRYTVYQDTVDTVYGRGIPDLDRLIGDSTTTYLSLVDTLGLPVTGVRAYRRTSRIDTSDGSGFIAIPSAPSYPDTILLAHEEFAFRTAILDSAGSWRSITMRQGYPTAISFTDNSGTYFLDGRIYWRSPGAQTVDSTDTERGLATVVFPDTQHYALWATAPFYFSSDTIDYQPFYDEDSISLTATPWPSLMLTLSDSLGDTIRHGTIYWRPMGAQTYHSSDIDTHGRATLHYTAGTTYELRVASPGYRVLQHGALKPDTVSASRLHLYLVAEPRAIIRVCDSACTAPASGASVIWWEYDSITRHHTPVDDDGIAALFLEPARYYRFWVAGDGFYASDTLRLHSDSIADTITVALGAKPRTLIRVCDSACTAPVRGATVVWWAKDSEARRFSSVDDHGFAVLGLEPSGSYRFYALADGYYPSDTSGFQTGTTVDTIPVALEPRPAVLIVEVTDTADTARRISRGTVFARRESAPDFTAYPLDSTWGTARIPAATHETYAVYVMAPGYARSSEIAFTVEQLPDTLGFVLQPRPVSRFAVYPTVVSLGRLKAGAHSTTTGVTIDFLAAEDNPRKHDQVCRIAIRTISGDIVWRFSAVLQEHEPARDERGRLPIWNCRARNGNYVAPGTYLISVEYAGKTHTRKVLIGG